MKQSLLAMLNETEQSLVREAEPARMEKLDEDELLELHARVRRARIKYTKLYRRGAARRVSKDASRGRASTTHQNAAAKAEIFEDVLSRVSRRLAKLARESAIKLRAERLDAARAERSAAGSGRTAKPPRASGGRGRASIKRGGDNQLRAPIKKKATASTRASGKRRQAKRDSR
jgi:hypothetical protein